MVEIQTDWLKNIKVHKALPNGKGIIAAIYEPTDKATKYGDKKVIQIVINGSDGSTINVHLFLPPNFPMVHPKSNLAKIMQRYGCNDLFALIGKEVEVEEVGDMIWKIKE